ncbi:SGNH/GDSL hydrolase family protein [Flavobacterium circumlabens]|uniref:Lysophospholipase L1-like esterase n=1 Tax=Flavobacterium circumlabens TaxID=2133765 RepID=A0A4Y7UJR4_9FLAO|nr:SGNH/GDSL hydrolase family protein [Flavobacterium circumlabens]TCN60911.1 lysophospholipase L1-like esterase [Flavobacterium circumlabens]TEB46029.1 SGNH/GDSL hydrolase family protein [Flavobacterium circumlabens]
MTTEFKQIVIVLFSIFLMSCSSDEMPSQNNFTVVPPTTTTPATVVTSINYLALGDSYTIGQSVCETCRYPEQLKASLKALYPQNSISLNVIAATGWTTTNLISEINAQNPKSNYDLVTLLIGVNNQYQGRNFSIYEKEFPELVTKAISLAKGDKKNVIVLSIPDYAYTPFGKIQMQGQGEKISADINKYNMFAENYCSNNNVVFVSITDITRQGLLNPGLVAGDGLHPSESAYTLFTERMLPKVKIALQN